eukprot:Gregarina_sp_Pseudo_9__3705@NODE_3856_length_542_cov_34_077535_g3536_i0_p1_GENE_NODE_3856_length_542_cov_34_077535_g3536_i0NODE_3856_length_542_cov_34_077535_g3536_i0_p1_ORF_typecomplete_len142_score17_54Exo_endo_phos/PF03372_23/0_0059_NODE_3856_length_542_cov_34_077535_g3536_i060485
MSDGSPSSHQDSNLRAAGSPKEAPTRSKPVETTNSVSDAPAILRETTGLKNERPRETDEDAEDWKDFEETVRELEEASRNQEMLGPEVMGMLSWNIGGLSEETAVRRTQAIIDCICLFPPTCVFLQEVTPATEAMFRKSLS